MDQLVEELKTVIPLKNTTEIGDIVIVVGHEPQMLLYGKITSIVRDPSKKEEWWNIGLTFLTVPLQNVVWTLRTEQMTGQEIFTMGGEKRFFQAVRIGNEENRTSPSIPGEKKDSPLKRIK